VDKVEKEAEKIVDDPVVEQKAKPEVAKEMEKEVETEAKPDLIISDAIGDDV
jgi:hypothetical protein